MVDAVSVRPASANLALTAIPDFDPARDRIYEREMFEKMRDDLHNALLRLELREEEVARVTTAGNNGYHKSARARAGKTA